MATITLLRLDDARQPDGMARPRLLLALDAFGAAALRGAVLPPDTVVAPAGFRWDDVDLLLDQALANAAWRDVQAVEPVIIVVADLGGAAAGEIATGLGAAITRALRAQIAVSAILVLRLLERGPECADAAQVLEQAHELLARLLASGQPGHGRVTVVLLSNRDGAGRVFQPDECMEMASHLIALLTDPGAGDDPRLRQVLAPLPPGPGEASDPWGAAAVFAAVTVRRLVYPEDDAVAAHTRAALSWLEPELAAHPPTSWEHASPALGAIGLEMDTRFGQVSLPVWEPDPWRSLDVEVASARAVVHAWIRQARSWDDEQQQRGASRRLALMDERALLLEDWRSQVEASLAGVLDDASLPGLWQSVRRWQAVILAGVTPSPPAPAAPDAPGDPAVLETRVVAAVHRRTNARAVLIMAAMTLLAGGGLILAAGAFGAVMPWVAITWSLAALALILPGPGALWALSAMALGVLLLTWLLWLGARLGSERAWKRDVHTPAREWMIRSADHYRATLRAHAAAEQAELARLATNDLQALLTRLDALQAAFAPSDVVTSTDLDAGSGVSRRLVPTPPTAPQGDPRAAAHALRRHPALLAWLTSGDPAEAPAIRDHVLADVAPDSPKTLAEDPAALATAVTRLPAGGDHRRVVNLKPRLLATPRWSVSEFLAAPSALVASPALRTPGVLLLPGAENQLVSLTLVSGLTAADLFGALDEPAGLSPAEEIA